MIDIFLFSFVHGFTTKEHQRLHRRKKRVHSVDVIEKSVFSILSNSLFEYAYLVIFECINTFLVANDQFCFNNGIILLSRV